MSCFSSPILSLVFFISIDHKKHVPDRVVDPLTASVEMAITQPPVKRMKIYPQDRGMEHTITSSTSSSSPFKHHTVSLTNELLNIHSVLIYAKQENEEVFHPLHLVPPSLVGLAVAVSIIYYLYFVTTCLPSLLIHVFFLLWKTDTKQVQIRSKEYSAHLQEMPKGVSTCSVDRL